MAGATKRSATQRVQDAQSWAAATSGPIALTDDVAVRLYEQVTKCERARPSKNLSAEGKALLPLLIVLCIELQDLVPDFRQLDTAEATRHLFEMHEILGAPYTWVPTISRSVAAYENVVIRARRTSLKRESYTWPRRWWTRRRFVSSLLFMLNLIPGVWHLLRDTKDLSGRQKLEPGFVGLAITALAGLWWWLGPIGAYVHTDDLEPNPETDVDFTADGVDAQQAAPTVGEPRGQDSELAALRDEVQRLRQSAALPGMPPPPGAPKMQGGKDPIETAGPSGLGMEAMRNFAQGTTPAGPVTQTGARTETYQPLLTMGAIHEDVRKILDTWETCVQKSAYDANWLRTFWATVAEQERTRRFPDVLRGLLQQHGYQGPLSIAQPKATFSTDLRQLASSIHDPGSTVGIGGLGAMASAMPDASVRWDVGLNPSMKRAAPETYKLIRSQGAVTVRDWFGQQKAENDHRYVDLWTTATTIDYMLAGCHNDAEKIKMLQENDQLELLLRRFASYIYERRTRDTKGAMHMLGQAPPGSLVDIGPDWLIADATLHSKLEHQRDAFVSRGRGQDRGGGRGRDQQHQETPQKSGGKGDKEVKAARGKARGRGAGR